MECPLFPEVCAWKRVSLRDYSKFTRWLFLCRTDSGQAVAAQLHPLLLLLTDCLQELQEAVRIWIWGSLSSVYFGPVSALSFRTGSETLIIGYSEILLWCRLHDYRLALVIMLGGGNLKRMPMRDGQMSSALCCPMPLLSLRSCSDQPEYCSYEWRESCNRGCTRTTESSLCRQQWSS